MSTSDIINITDQYGYNPRLFIGGYPKHGTIVGVITSIFSWLFLIAIFIYYLIKLVCKKEMNTLTSKRYFTNEDLVLLDKENFFFTFTLENPKTYESFVDETIYYPSIYHRTGVRMENGLFNYSNSTKLTAVRCKLEYFGSEYQKLFVNYSLSDMYCIKDLNKTLFGTFSDHTYSFIILNLFPCKNKTNSSIICQPKENISYYLNGTFFSLQYQNINLDPKDYANPTKKIIGDYMTTVSLNYIKTAYIYLKKILLKTDNGLIFEDIQKKSFTAYDYTTDYINFKSTSSSFFTLNIRMSTNVEEVARSYQKVQTMLGYIGGFCTFINNLFFWFNNIFMHNMVYEKVINKIFFNSNIKSKNKNIDYLSKLFLNKDILVKNNNNFNNNTSVLNLNYNSSSYNFTEEISNNVSQKKFMNLTNNSKSKIKNINMNNLNIKNQNNLINFIRYKKFESMQNNLLNHKNKNINNNIKINYIRKLFLQCYCFRNKTHNNKKLILYVKGYNLIKEKLDIIGIIKHLNQNEIIKKIFLKNDHNFLLDYYIKDDINEFNYKNNIYNLDADFSEDENCIRAFDIIINRKENNNYNNEKKYIEFIDDIFINAIKKQA